MNLLRRVDMTRLSFRDVVNDTPRFSKNDGGRGLVLPRLSYAGPDVLSGLYDLPPFGQLTLMHMTDCHAQLVPTYFREPNINIGIGEANGRLPHVVGDKLLKYMGFKHRKRF